MVAKRAAPAKKAAKPSAARKTSKSGARTPALRKPKASTPAAKPVTRAKGSSSPQAAAKRRALFVEAYITNGGNATQAGIAAGLSPKTAASQGARLSNHVEVKAALAKRQEELANRYKLTTENVIKSLAQAVFFDPRKLYNADGSLKPVHELDEDTAAALAGLEVVEMAGGAQIGGGAALQHVAMYTKKVKWIDKNTARDQAMRHLGQYKPETVELTGKNGGPIEIKNLSNAERAVRLAALLSSVKGRQA